MDKAERRLGRYAIKNLTFWLMIGQIFVFAMGLFTTFPVERLALIPTEVLKGEAWRVFTFLFFPPETSLIFMAFAWYIFYLTGSALEEAWGAFRYNLFVLVGTLATAAAAFATPQFPATNAFLGTSVFLAFAYLYPNFQFMLFFILPVKVKWLAWITWGFYAVTFIMGTMPARFMVLAATLNFFLFFAWEMFQRGKAVQRRKAFEKEAKEMDEEPFHICCICGATDKTHPEATFVYKNGR
ncbi:MAG: hypothetical protein AAGA45_08030, partial [Verrucomicrobiota bacterium]